MRRVRLDNGTKTNIGYLDDNDGFGVVIDAEAVAIVDPQTWIDPMSTRRVALVATNRAVFGDLGWSLRRGNSADCSNSNLACTCDNNVNCPPDYINSACSHYTANYRRNPLHLRSNSDTKCHVAFTLCVILLMEFTLICDLK